MQLVEIVLISLRHSRNFVGSTNSALHGNEQSIRVLTAAQNSSRQRLAEELLGTVAQSPTTRMNFEVSAVFEVDQEVVESG